MNDRELLELAAKAAGYLPWGSREEGLVFLIGGLPVIWSPLTDDGDRYQLARACKLSIDFEDCTAWRRMTNHHLIQEFWGGDHGEEAYAIVRAAAEIGKAMP